MTEGAIFFVFVLVLLYFLPSLVAAARERQAGAVFALNFFLGWTLVGWVVALVWALTSADKAVPASALPVGPAQSPPPPPTWNEPRDTSAPAAPAVVAQFSRPASGPTGPTELQGEAIATRLRARARSLGLAEQPGEDDGPASQTAAGLAPVGAFLEYADAAGQASARTITLRRLEDGANGPRILAWCHMRRAPRRFLASRIVALTDITTGEVHDGPAGALAWLAEIARQSEAAGGTLVDAATVLAFVAAADEALVAEEREAAAVALEAAAAASGANAEAAAALAARLPSLAPDGAAARQAAARLKAQPEDLRAQIAAGMTAVIAADGALHPREQAAAADLARAMGVQTT